MRHKIFLIIFIILVLMMMGYADNQVSMSIGGGLSGHTGDDSDYWEMGYTFSGIVLINLTPNIQIGGRIAYYKWKMDINRIFSAFHSSYQDLGYQISAKASITELSPTIRILTNKFNKNKIKLFAQFSSGLYNLKTDTSIGKEKNGVSFSPLMDNKTKLGINGGCGIIIGKVDDKIRFELLPQYHIVFYKDENLKYFSFTISTLFDL